MVNVRLAVALLGGLYDNTSTTQRVKSLMGKFQIWHGRVTLIKRTPLDEVVKGGLSNITFGQKHRPV